MTDVQRINLAGRYYDLAGCLPLGSASWRALMELGDDALPIGIAPAERPGDIPAQGLVERIRGSWQRRAVAIAGRSEDIEDVGLEGPAIGG